MLIIGCGYLGRRFAQIWRGGSDLSLNENSENSPVFGLTRSAKKGEVLRDLKICPLQGDVLDRGSLSVLRNLPGLSTVLYAVGFDRSSGVSMREVYVDGLRNVLDSLPTSVDRFLYVSSTGVYGQMQDEWVDEESPCHPSREGGKVCLAAEQVLLAHPMGERTVILRMAGIYGPGRIPYLDALQRGERIRAPTEGFLNLIHVDDAAQVVLAAQRKAAPPRTYLVSDGQPVLRSEFYEYAAKRLGGPPPRFEIPEGDTLAAIRAGTSKRIVNRRMMEELQLTLLHADYRRGLDAILGAEPFGPS